MTTKERLHTIEDWLNTPDDGKRYELVEGELIEMPSSSQRNAILAAYIIHLLLTYVLPRKLGFVTGPDSGYKVNSINAYQPDAAFISTERAGEIDKVAFPVPPDLAVEVISPSETARYILKKARAYLTAGSRLVWAVHPDDKVVDVYRLASDGNSLNVQTLGVADTLDGGDVLPGFTLKVADLFAVLD